MQEAEKPPWEEPGNFRLDCEPHRAHFLLFMGNVSMAMGILALCTFLPTLINCIIAFAVGVMARNDLAKMSAGLMDPMGENLTMMATRRAVIGVALGMLPWLACLATFLVALGQSVIFR
jgi:hypothetical protein